MHDLLDDIDRWRRAGRRIAVARVVDIEGSGPRDPGAAMAVTDDGEVAGSVSGGCVEGAVVAEAFAEVAARLAAVGRIPELREEHWGAPRAFVSSPAGHRIELMAAPPPP